jgi:hypothetical protein
MEKMPSTRTLKAKKEENQWKDEGTNIIYSSLGREEGERQSRLEYQVIPFSRFGTRGKRVRLAEGWLSVFT